MSAHLVKKRAELRVDAVKDPRRLFDQIVGIAERFQRRLLLNVNLYGDGNFSLIVRVLALHY